MSDELFAATSGETTLEPVLPCPSRERWQPLRSGVLNIYKYDQEEFSFEEGRLLLRGNNGAGKSRVLALQLPFLLDGEMASHRVEPDGDPAKRIEWNLLMNKHENRLGYTWIEFGRRDSDGTEHYVTLGCGMHARKGTGIPPGSRWYFVTHQRVGQTFRLMSENRVPLTRERLEAAIGQNSVHRTASAYRSAVDGVLFGLGTRYEPLIDLLLQLRKPQIMRDFKADDLSQLLSEALPPLSPRLIENVSVSFRSLESDRQQLAELTEVRKSVDTFLKSYSHYIRVAVRRRAADVRRAARKVFDQIMANRTRAIAAVAERNLELEKCVARRKEEATRFDQRRDDVMRCEEEEAGLRTQRNRALESLVEQIFRWEASLEILPILKEEDWNGLLEAWLETPDTVSPLTERIDIAHQSAMQRISDERSQSDRAQKEQAKARIEIIDQLDVLRVGRQPEPPTPYTRGVETRLDRPGAPLWKLCDFREEISAADRAGYEAALEAAGLLDGWVTRRAH